MDDDLDAMEGAGRPGGGLGYVAVLAGAAVLVGAALLGSSLLGRRPGGTGPGDGSPEALLAEGKALYEWRCASCHGVSGRGDGPVAGGLRGPGPGDLTDDEWAHGDRPDQVLAVIARGVPGTEMAGWASSFTDRELRALASYMYRLAGREAPEALLAPLD